MESISFHLTLIQNNVTVRRVPVKGTEVLAEGGKHVPVCLELAFADDHRAVTKKAGFPLLVQPLQEVLAVMGILHFDNGQQPLCSDLGKKKKNMYLHARCNFVFSFTA